MEKNLTAAITLFSVIHWTEVKGRKGVFKTMGSSNEWFVSIRQIDDPWSTYIRRQPDGENATWCTHPKFFTYKQTKKETK